MTRREELCIKNSLAASLLAEPLDDYNSTIPSYDLSPPSEMLSFIELEFSTKESPSVKVDVTSLFYSCT